MVKLFCLQGGPSNSAPQYYSYGPHYPAHPYHHHTPPGATSHVPPTGAPTHPIGTPPPPNCNSHPSGPVHQPGMYLGIIPGVWGRRAMVN